MNLRDADSGKLLWQDSDDLYVLTYDSPLLIFFRSQQSNALIFVIIIYSILTSFISNSTFLLRELTSFISHFRSNPDVEHEGMFLKIYHLLSLLVIHSLAFSLLVLFFSFFLLYIYKIK